MIYDMGQLEDLTAMLVEEAMAASRHDLALTALLAAFVKLAEKNPCCARASADGAFQAHVHLLNVAATGHPASTVH